MPTVFISYAWEDKGHRDWVKGLATRLRQHGIDAMADFWGVEPGAELTQFMELGIARSDRVLLVCTPEYRRRANARKGGVGFEGRVISAELAAGLESVKFIPILRRGDWAEAAPTYLGSTNYLDFRDGADTNEAYGMLVKALLQIEPEPPPLGEVVSPEFIESQLQAQRIRVFVGGTGEYAKDTKLRPELDRSLSEELGRWLASNDFDLATTDWPNVDEWVSEAFIETLRAAGQPVGTRYVQFFGDRGIPGLGIEGERRVRLRGGLVEEHSGHENLLRVVDVAQIAVIIGGWGAALRQAELALSQGKPVLPVPGSGGNAREAYRRLMQEGVEDWPKAIWGPIGFSEFIDLARETHGEGRTSMLEPVKRMCLAFRDWRALNGPPAQGGHEGAKRGEQS